MDRAREDGPGDHQPRSFDREGAIDREPEIPLGGFGAAASSGRHQMFANGVDTLAGNSRHRKDRRAGQPGRIEK